jgi:hypothetical protein
MHHRQNPLPSTYLDFIYRQGILQQKFATETAYASFYSQNLTSPNQGTYLVRQKTFEENDSICYDLKGNLTCHKY